MAFKRPETNSDSIKTTGFALLATLLVSACSSSDSAQPADDALQIDPDNDDRAGLAIEGLNGTPADQVVSPWLANMRLFRLDSQTPGTGDATIELLQYNNDFPASAHIDFYTPELDTCDIRDLTGSGGDGGDGDENRPALISGGQTLTINSPSGTWFELQSGSVGIYETNNGLPSAFPDGLTLSIPGADFPTVAAYPLMEPEPPIRIMPASDLLTMADVTSPFTWVAGDGAPGSFMEIAAIAFDAEGDFVGFPVVCAVQDDGSFTMPQSVVDEFAATDLTIRTRFDRVINRVDIINGIVFHQESTVGE